MIAPASASASEQDKGRYYGAKETEYPDRFKTSFLDFQEDVAEAAAEGRRVMVIFHQKGCPCCNALVERDFSQSTSWTTTAATSTPSASTCGATAR